MNNKLKPERSTAILYEYLSKLDAMQFKLFYGAFVHYWVNHKYFISKQNFFNLWCELNFLCHDLDESFPDQYDDHEAIRTFCNAHPYYFIDRLPIDMIAELFAEYVDDRIDILTNFVKILSNTDIYAAYTYTNESLGLDESVGTLVSEAYEHIKLFP